MISTKARPALSLVGVARRVSIQDAERRHRVEMLVARFRSGDSSDRGRGCAKIKSAEANVSE